MSSDISQVKLPDNILYNIKALSLVESVKTTDETPYAIRQTPITANRTLEKLIGVSCAFNQLVRNGNFANWSEWSKYNANVSVNNNECAITAIGNSSQIYQTFEMVAYHVYIVHAQFKSSVSGLKCGSGFTGGGYSVVETTPNYSDYYRIVRPSESSDYSLVFYSPNSNSGDVWNVKNTYYIDLTACFGSEVADYFYNLEQNTAGSGIALFRQLFPEDYYAYQTATLISSKPTSRVVVGVNQWDEKWELGLYNSSDGTPFASNSYIRSKSSNYISVIPNTNYYICSPQTIRVFEYDNNYQYIRYTDRLNNGLTLSDNCRYIRFCVYDSSYGTTYNHDISINLPLTDHNYHAYEKHTYPLGGDELRGLLKVENGNLVAYGDIKPSDGNGTEVFDIVDLGDVEWTRLTDGAIPYFRHVFSDSTMTQVKTNFLTDAYEKVPFADIYTNGKDKACASYAGGVFIVSDTTYSTASDFKTAMSGKYLIYEKATPTAKSYTPFTNPMLCGSTEEFTDSRSLKMFCGHQSQYYTETEGDKINYLPEIAGKNGDKFVIENSNGKMVLSSADYINKHIYIEHDEHIVGTWIDGKPIYERTVDVTFSSNETTKMLDFTNHLHPIIAIISVNGFLLDEDTNQNCLINGDGGGYYAWFESISNNIVTISRYSSSVCGSTPTAYVTAQYIKAD